MYTAEAVTDTAYGAVRQECVDKTEKNKTD